MKAMTSTNPLIKVKNNIADLENSENLDAGIVYVPESTAKEICSPVR
jgi:hypothetical protein